MNKESIKMVMTMSMNFNEDVSNLTNIAMLNSNNDIKEAYKYIKNISPIIDGYYTNAVVSQVKNNLANEIDKKYKEKCKEISIDSIDEFSDELDDCFKRIFGDIFKL